MKRSSDSTHHCWSHPQRTVLIKLRQHGHKLLSRNTMTWRPVTGDRQHRIHAKLPKYFPEIPVAYFPEVEKTRVYVVGILQKILEKFAGEWKFGLQYHGRDEKLRLGPNCVIQLSEFPSCITVWSPQFANLSVPFQNTRQLDTHEWAEDLDYRIKTFQVGFYRNLQSCDYNETEVLTGEVWSWQNERNCLKRQSFELV